MIKRYPVRVIQLWLYTLSGSVIRLMIVNTVSRHPEDRLLNQFDFRRSIGNKYTNGNISERITSFLHTHHTVTIRVI